MKVIITTQEKKEYFRIYKFDGPQFYVDEYNNLYLVHGAGVTQLSFQNGNTFGSSTRDFGDVSTPKLRPLPEGTEIKFLV